MQPHVYWILALMALFIQRESKNTINPPKKIEALLVGSPHWSNYGKAGLDVVQTTEIDVLSERYQSELERITDKIREFNPDKIFLEYSTDQQAMVDSLFQAYLRDNYGEKVRSEAVQMGFRVARKAGHKRVYCIDYRDVSFDFESVITAAQEAGQQELMSGIMQEVEQLQASYNKIIQGEPSIEEVLGFLNSDENLKRNLGFYLNKINMAGSVEDYAGSLLVSEWYRRNLYIYANIQNLIEPGDQRIMVLMGAGHIAILKDFMEYDDQWELVGLSEVF